MTLEQLTAQHFAPYPPRLVCIAGQQGCSPYPVQVPERSLAEMVNLTMNLQSPEQVAVPYVRPLSHCSPDSTILFPQTLVTEGVHDWEVVGVPVQPEGVEETTERVCVPEEEQVDQES